MNYTFLCICVQQLEDEIQISFHGVAYVDFAPLLYPGVRRIRGAYRIHTFSESDFLIKVGVGVSTGEIQNVSSPQGYSCYI